MASRIATLVHLTGVLLFLGNFVAAWLVYSRARRADDATVVARLFGLISTGDRWLTPVPVMLIVGSGVYAARLRGLSVTGTGWIIWSLMALGLAGAVFLGKLRGLQHRLEQPTGRPELDLPAYRVMLSSWGRWAAVGSGAVLIAFGLMVLRPHLPGF